MRIEQFPPISSSENTFPGSVPQRGIPLSSSSLSTLREGKPSFFVRAWNAVMNFFRWLFCCGCMKKDAPLIHSSPDAPVSYVERKEEDRTEIQVQEDGMEFSFCLVEGEDEKAPVLEFRSGLSSAVEAAMAASIVRHQGIEEVKVADFVLAKALIDEGFEIHGDILVDSFGVEDFKNFVTTRIALAESREQELSPEQKKALEALVRIRGIGFQDPALRESTCLVARYPLALFLQVITTEDAKEAKRCKYSLQEVTFSLPKDKQLDE